VRLHHDRLAVAGYIEDLERAASEIPAANQLGGRPREAVSLLAGVLASPPLELHPSWRDDREHTLAAEQRGHTTCFDARDASGARN
jgi:hypothetical protein